MSIPPDIGPRHRAVLWLAAVLIAVLHPVMMVRHYRKLGRWANPAWPLGLTDKLMWRKLFDRNPLFVTVTDKLTAREYVAQRAPQLPQTRVLWAGYSAHDIPDEVMVGPAMVKPTNGSGINFIVADGRPDRETIARRARHLVGPRGNRRREEWAYWPIRGQFVAEELLTLGGNGLPTDLKAYVAGGRVCCVWANDRPADMFLTLSPEGVLLPDPDRKATLPWSERIAKLVREAAGLAPTIAAEFDMMRVDFLVGPDGLLAGELTVYSDGGYERWENPEIAAEIADAWDLRASWFLRQPHRGPMGVYSEALIAAETARLGPLPTNVHDERDWV